MLRVRKRMRSGAYASSRQDTDYTGGGVVRSFDPWSVTRGTACLTSVCVQADLSRCLSRKALWAVECSLFGYNKVSGCFEKLYCIVN
jgi:hypothetical protein